MLFIFDNPWLAKKVVSQLGRILSVHFTQTLLFHRKTQVGETPKRPESTNLLNPISVDVLDCIFSTLSGPLHEKFALKELFPF